MITRKEMRKLLNEWQKLYLGVARMKRDSDMVSFNGFPPIDFETAVKEIHRDFEMVKGRN